MTRHWWRVGLVGVAVVMAAFVADSVAVGVVGVVPLLVWCVALARSARAGIVGGLVLLVVLAWFLVPRGVGWSGRWVPSADEALWLHLLVAALVCGVGVTVERRGEGGRWVAALAVGGGCAAAVLMVVRLEAPPGDEGVLPGPPGLAVVEGDGYCGSGNCSRDVTVSGERAAERVRGLLAERGYRPRGESDDRMCRLTGVLVAHEVCADLRDDGNATRVEWYVN